MTSIAQKPINAFEALKSSNAFGQRKSNNEFEATQIHKNQTMPSRLLN